MSFRFEVITYAKLYTVLTTVCVSMYETAGNGPHVSFTALRKWETGSGEECFSHC